MVKKNHLGNKGVTAFLLIFFSIMIFIITRELKMIEDLMASQMVFKEKRLREIVKKLDRVIIGYSGGVDSTLVAKIATEELGVNALVVISDSPSLPRSELKEALELAKQHHFHTRIIHTQEAEKEEYLANPNNRCFYCKTELYGDLEKIRVDEKFTAILDGANLDDLGDFRPGRKAASEKGVKSVLIEAQLNKKEVRELAKKLNLPNFDKPAAACLSSRFPYGTSITKQKLSQVELAEEFLKNLKLKNVRVRYHLDVARIEVDQDSYEIILENAQNIYTHFKTLGFKYTALDIMGFRSGSMNE